ncbi:hypothetical protein TNCV_4746271 [Trichonephila clavipes]|nr:hypothetical protein TNCV_4746271 [Trichonephila clavipes]
MSCFTYIHGVDDGLLNFSSIVRRRINERAGMLRFFEAPMQSRSYLRSLKVVNLGLDMDNSHHIIIRSNHFCPLTCYLKFPVFEEYVPRIIFDHYNYQDQDLIKSESRTKRGSFEDEDMGPGPDGPCLKTSI